MVKDGDVMYRFGVFFRMFFSCAFIAILILGKTHAVDFSISAQSAVLINPQNNEIIFEHNANQQLGMASTTKIMTAIVAIENGDLDRKYIIPSDAVGVEGSSLYLKEGEEMTLRELLIGLMLRSANDAAEAIAIIVGGSVEGFADMMNNKADALGLKDTHFTNPHGLADSEHYTTAKELAFISAYALKNATFKSICSLSSATLPGIEYSRQVTNHNKLLYTYDGAYGVKTGFTKATGRCLVSAAKRNEIDLIAVTLNAPDDWKDHRTMLDYGFSLFEKVELAKTGEFLCAVPIIGGDKNTLPIYFSENVSVCLKKSRGSIVQKIELNRPRFAPIYEGDILGTVSYFIDEKLIYSLPIYSPTYIGKNKT